MLHIQKGIITDPAIAGVPFERAILPKDASPYVRTGIPMTTIRGITNHNTGNPAPTADARAHAHWLAGVEARNEAYIGAHFFVDQHRIVQTLPINEVAWHAGDGQGPGNISTVAIEICESQPAQAEANAILLNAALLITYPNWQIYKHQDWSGKFCPRLILGQGRWPAFVQAIQTTVNRLRAEAQPQPTAKAQAAPSPWAREAVAWAQATGLLRGRTEGPAYQAPASREEVLAFLYRLHGDHHA